MATKKMPAQTIAKPSKSTLQKPGVTPSGKKPAPATPVQAAPVRMNVGKKGSRGC